MIIRNDQEHAAAVERMIQLEYGPDPANNAELNMLAQAVDDYEETSGHTPDPPRTLRGILEVEMFKRKLKQSDLAQLLEVPEARLVELLEGGQEMNLDFARRLYTKLSIPADVVFAIAA